jgi:hypothetical protein
MNAKTETLERAASAVRYLIGLAAAKGQSVTGMQISLRQIEASIARVTAAQAGNGLA